MGYFNELSPSTLKAIDLLIADSTLVKLIYYNEKNCLYQPTVSNPSSLLMTKIFPIPKIPDSQSDATTFLNVYWDDISPNNINSGYRNESLKIAIVIHLNVMLIDNAIRQYEIMSCIDKIFNNQYYEVIAPHKLQANGRIKPIQVNGDYWAYIMSYSAVNLSG